MADSAIAKLRPSCYTRSGCVWDGGRRVAVRVVDLFCGCGGLSLGARAAGFEVAGSVDKDPILTSSYTTNFPDANLRLLDLNDVSGSNLLSTFGAVDGLIGGPPCQGFSEVGRGDPDDPRRGLLRHFFRLVAEVQPRFFLAENVRGLAFAKNRSVLDDAIGLVCDRYEIVGPLLLDSAGFGAATKRPRIFVLGYDRDHVDPLRGEDVDRARTEPVDVRRAIGDLRHAVRRADDGEGFDVWTYTAAGRPSPYARLLRAANKTFTGHRQVPHRPEVAARFAAVTPGSMDRVGRHPRLRWDGQCPTLRAGTGVERGSFQAVRPIHPEEPRVITVREAARLQGFPDRFRFHPTTWHSFRMIGNSVSPIMAGALLRLLAARVGVRPADNAA